MGIWRLRGDDIEQLKEQPLESEEQLEKLLEDHPELIFDGEPLLVIGRQHSTDLGRPMDLLALDGAGRTVVAELKKQKTPRDVVAQALEYASYIASLEYRELDTVATSYFQAKDKPWGTLEEAFGEYFGAGESETPRPDVVWNGT